MVFVTASPVLTNEVKTYYHSLKQKLADNLKLKEIKVASKEGEANAVSNQGEELKADNLDESSRQKLEAVMQIKEQEFFAVDHANE